MKTFYSKQLLVFLLLYSLVGATGANAQNRCLLRNDKGLQTNVTSSYGKVISYQDGPLTTFATMPEVKPQAKGTTATHTLSITTMTGWHSVSVFDDGSGEFIKINPVWEIHGWPPQGDTFNLELEEGVYYVAVEGASEDSTGQVFGYYWLKDGIELYDETELTANYNECIYDFNVDLVDENGNSFDNMEFVRIDYITNLQWMIDAHVFSELSMCYESVNYIEQIPIRCNGFDEHSSVILTVRMDPGNNKTYMMESPTIRGLHDSYRLTVTADDLSVIKEKFTDLKHEDECWYYTDYLHYLNDRGGWFGSNDFYFFLRFDTNQPYTIVSNARVYDSNNSETGHKTVLVPKIFDGYNIGDFDDPIYKGDIYTPFYLDADGNVVREAKPFFMYRDALVYEANYPNIIPETPCVKVLQSGSVINYGERTPLVHYHPQAFNANNTPIWGTHFEGTIVFSGEQSCVRTCDNDANVRIWIDGEEYFNDSVMIFNYGNYGQSNLIQTDPVKVVVEVNDDHLFANTVPKTNFTRVQFDLAKDDAIPPTMTFLRVLDGNGDEVIYHDNLPQSTLVFGCADYTFHFSELEGDHYDHLDYNAKPTVEILYNIEGEDWEPLVFEEDESLFHINYGNVFVVELGQLEGIANDKWVNLKFVLTDEAGNNQTQELSNVFYAGEMVSVEENTVNRLQHEVFPNPFNGEVRITSSEAINGNANINVYNVLGTQIHHQTINCANTTEFVWDGSQVPSGIYFYSISTKDGLLQGKIIKE